MGKPVGTGMLFEKTAKSIFMKVSGTRYDNMLVRVLRKGFPGLPFSKAEFRKWLFEKIGSTYDGFVRCRYCTGFVALADVGIDHAQPLARGGGVDLDNLDLPCKACNSRKGEMLPSEYGLLLELLDERLPLAKQDVLRRLEMSVQLAAGASSTAGTIKALKDSGDWQRALKTQRRPKGQRRGRR